MNIFHCDHCDQPIFFENYRCLSCEHRLAFLPDVRVMASLEQVSGTELWRSVMPRTSGHAYRLCRNYDESNICNWTVSADDPNPFCVSCRLTRLIPDLSVPGNTQAWYRLESAKRRLVYSLLQLQLPLRAKLGNEREGLAFEFLADTTVQRVLTGHSNGVITLNIEEADDAKREQRRVQLHEPYRTLLGHFRHEVGHYYWNVLIEESPRIDGYRALFGDEREDYAEALKRHYANGPAADWPAQFISAYASSHPWEDWAETWAHYLHIIDALETAHAAGLALRPDSASVPALEPRRTFAATHFDQLLHDWFALTFVLNNLNRGLGLQDGYPFVLSAPVIAKLRFVHDLVHQQRV